jgi:hypothetical protein
MPISRKNALERARFCCSHDATWDLTFARGDQKVNIDPMTRDPLALIVVLVAPDLPTLTNYAPLVAGDPCSRRL